jgi:hypothetical protein
MPQRLVGAQAERRAAGVGEEGASRDHRMPSASGPSTAGRSARRAVGPAPARQAVRRLRGYWIPRPTRRLFRRNRARAAAGGAPPGSGGAWNAVAGRAGGGQSSIGGGRQRAAAFGL